MVLHNKLYGLIILLLSSTLLITCIYEWLKELVIEGTILGNHTKSVERNIELAYILFIISEVVIFASLFYGNFYNSILVSIELGLNYPPLGISSINPLGIPLLNTILLISGSITITAVHHLIKSSKKWIISLLLLLTIILNIIFTYLQGIEYMESSFTMSDSIYGTNLYALTGLHGLHVIFGTGICLICFIRHLLNHYTNEHHQLINISSIYIHFVDVIWLLLFLSIYIIGY